MWKIVLRAIHKVRTQNVLDFWPPSPVRNFCDVIHFTNTLAYALARTPLPLRAEVLYDDPLYNNQIISFPHNLSFWKQYADMIIGKGVPLLLPAGLRMGTAQLSGKKNIFFKKYFFLKRFISLKYALYRHLSMQISTFFFKNMCSSHIPTIPLCDVLALHMSRKIQGRGVKWKYGLHCYTRPYYHDTSKHSLISAIAGWFRRIMQLLMLNSCRLNKRNFLEKKKNTQKERKKRCIDGIDELKCHICVSSILLLMSFHFSSKAD